MQIFLYFALTLTWNIKHSAFCVGIHYYIIYFVCREVCRAVHGSVNFHIRMDRQAAVTKIIHLLDGEKQQLHTYMDNFSKFLHLASILTTPTQNVEKNSTFCVVTQNIYKRSTYRSSNQPHILMENISTFLHLALIFTIPTQNVEKKIYILRCNT